MLPAPMTQERRGNEVGRTGRSPFFSWQFWGGILTGLGCGMALGAAIVEREWLSAQGETWVIRVAMLVFFLAGIFVANLAGRTKRNAS